MSSAELILGDTGVARPEFAIEPPLPAERLPLLVTGVAGVTGYHAFRSLRDRYGDLVWGQRRLDNRRLSGPGILACDLEDPAAAAELFDKHRFRAVLDAAGTCALKNCEADPSMAIRGNITGTQNLLDQVKRYQCRLVRVSIDLVFGGTRGGDHREEDATDPVTMYGKTMLTAESMVREQTPDALMLRISLPMGPSFNGHAGAIDWIRHRFRHGRPATLYYDEVRTPTYCQCLDPIFETALSGDESGLLHAGGVRWLSLYEIAQIVNRVGGYPPELLHGCYRLEAGPMPPRAGNVTMNSSRLPQVLGVPSCQPWPADPRFVPTDREWHYRRDDWQGSEELLEQVLYRRPVRTTMR